MFVLKTVIFCAAWLAVTCQGQHGPTTTPVPILKQVNRQNDDGSYSFGYEAADGSFKIETKYANGDVAGKYGYVDEGGKLREISYGASSKRGFEPEGPGIMVPPPTLYDPSSTNALTDGQEDDGQYREDPSIYEDPKYNGRAQSSPRQSFRQYQAPAQPAQVAQPAQPQYQTQAPASRFQPFHTSQPQQTQYRAAPLYTQQSNLQNQAPQQFPQDNSPQTQQGYRPQRQQDFNLQSQQDYSPQSQQNYRPQSQVYHQQPQFSYQSYTPQPYQGFQNQQYQNLNYQNQDLQGQNYNPYLGHPAQNLDTNTGSYSINYTGK